MVRRTARPWSVLVLLTALLLVTLSSVTPVSAKEVHVRIGLVAGGFLSFDPHRGYSGHEHQVLFAVFDQLIRYDVEGNFLPGLAESWEWVGDTTLILNLRRGVRFHDGTPFNAEAVVWNFQRIMDPETGSFIRGEWSDVTSVEAVDEYTVKIELRQPSSAFLAYLADRSGAIVSPTAVRAMGDQKFGVNPVGAGPFIFKEWVDGSHVTLVRNPDFWEEGYPKADRITLYEFRSHETKVRALMAGDLDFIWIVPEKDVQWFVDHPDFVFVNAPTIATILMSYNNTMSPLDDVNLRRAIQAAIDRDTVLRIAEGGLGSVSPSLYPRGFWSVDPTLEVPPYDPEGARKYLAQSKYAGETIDFVVANDPVSIRAAQVVQQMLADIGVKISIQPMQGAEVSARYYERAEAHGRIGGWSGRPDPDVNYYARLGCGGSYNAPRPRGYCDPVVDELLDKGRTTTDPKGRAAIYAELDRHVLDQALHIPLWFRSWSAAMRKELTGFKPYLFGKPIYRELGLAN